MLTLKIKGKKSISALKLAKTPEKHDISVIFEVTGGQLPPIWKRKKTGEARKLCFNFYQNRIIFRHICPRNTIFIKNVSQLNISWWYLLFLLSFSFKILSFQFVRNDICHICYMFCLKSNFTNFNSKIDNIIKHWLNFLVISTFLLSFSFKILSFQFARNYIWPQRSLKITFMIKNQLFLIICFFLNLFY